MQVALVGVTGYSGMVLYRLLKQHPEIDRIQLYGHVGATTVALKTVAAMYQKETAVIRPFDATAIMRDNAIVFFATSAGITRQLALPSACMIQSNISGGTNVIQHRRPLWHRRATA